MKTVARVTAKDAKEKEERTKLALGFYKKERVTFRPKAEASF